MMACSVALFHSSFHFCWFCK